jgi:hypothetical protein
MFARCVWEPASVGREAVPSDPNGPTSAPEAPPRAWIERRARVAPSETERAASQSIFVSYQAAGVSYQAAGAFSELG